MGTEPRRITARCPRATYGDIAGVDLGDRSNSDALKWQQDTHKAKVEAGVRTTGLQMPSSAVLGCADTSKLLPPADHFITISHSQTNS